jgi:hypothetical protein
VITINILICGWKTLPLVMITKIAISLRYTWVTNIQWIPSKTIYHYNNNTCTLSHIFLWNTEICKWKYSQYHTQWKHNVYYSEWRHIAKGITIEKITQRFVSFEFALILLHASVSNMKRIGSSWPCKYIFISHTKCQISVIKNNTMLVFRISQQNNDNNKKKDKALIVI